MEVSMDTTSRGLSPLPQSQSQSQSQPPSESEPKPTTSTTPDPGSPRKRSLQENGTASTTTTTEDGYPSVRVEIPLSSIPTPNTNIDQPPSTPANGSGNANTPAAKKRKLSPSSKEAKQQEKEAKDRQRAEEKVKKEEERRAKEEEKKKREAEREDEKKKREAEREEKKRAKDEERMARDEEKRKRDEEKSKKERAQMKLNAFFVKPKSPVKPSTAGPGESPKKNVSEDAANEAPKEAASDYQRVFPDFFLQSHTKVAPPHRFERDSEALQVMRQRVDEAMRSKPQEPPVFRPSELFRMIPYKRRRGRQAASVKDILLQIQSMGSSGDVAPSKPDQPPLNLLNKVRMKSLKFSEDVRPPYQGTYTKKVPESSAHQLSRNPYRRGLPETNYDYDSEAEWEEPEEGEELDSEEEEEGSDDGDDDMEGFLDDEDDQPVDGKRRLIVGDLEPQNTGLRWQETTGVVDPAVQAYQMQTISDSVSFPIDPFSTVYWQKPPKPDPSTSNTVDTTSGGNSNTTPEGVHGLALLGTGPGKAKRSFPTEQLGEFKAVVDGSDLTKMGLVEILKKRFPKVSKETLKETLNGLATRVGSKEAEKKWVCR